MLDTLYPLRSVPKPKASVNDRIRLVVQALHTSMKVGTDGMPVHPVIRLASNAL